MAEGSSGTLGIGAVWPLEAANRRAIMGNYEDAGNGNLQRGIPFGAPSSSSSISISSPSASRLFLPSGPVAVESSSRARFRWSFSACDTVTFPVAFVFLMFIA